MKYIGVFVDRLIFVKKKMDVRKSERYANGEWMCWGTASRLLIVLTPIYLGKILGQISVPYLVNTYFNGVDYYGVSILSIR